MTITFEQLLLGLFVTMSAYNFLTGILVYTRNTKSYILIKVIPIILGTVGLLTFIFILAQQY